MAHCANPCANEGKGAFFADSSAPFSQALYYIDGSQPENIKTARHSCESQLAIQVWLAGVIVAVRAGRQACGGGGGVECCFLIAGWLVVVAFVNELRGIIIVPLTHWPN